MDEQIKPQPPPQCGECKGKGWLMTRYGFPVPCPACQTPKDKK